MGRIAGGTLDSINEKRTPETFRGSRLGTYEAMNELIKRGGARSLPLFLGLNKGNGEGAPFHHMLGLAYYHLFGRAERCQPHDFTPKGSFWVCTRCGRMVEKR